jgi:DNA-directed RNA polymerase subunit RPC12/RpoP
MKICNKCEVIYPDTNLFCKNCHSLLQLQKAEMDNSKPNKKAELVKNHSEKKNKIVVKTKEQKHDISKNYIYSEWEPPALTTIYSRVKNIPYGLLKYDLSKGLHPNEMRQIESHLNNHDFRCGNCSYYTNFEHEICSLKTFKIESNAICKSFELKPEFQFSSLKSNNKEEKQDKKKRKEEEKRKIREEKSKKKYRCVTCQKMFRSEDDLEKHRNVKKH